MSIDKNHIKIPEFVIEYLSNPEDRDLHGCLMDWLENEQNHKVFNELNDIWQSSLLVAKKDSYNTKDAWKKLTGSIPIHARRKTRGLSSSAGSIVKYWLIAGSIIIGIVILGALGYKCYQNNYKYLQFTEYMVPYGSRSNVVLPDGSEVWINAGSVLKYNSNYALRNREIYLNGEAYFKVKPDTRIPFEVKLKTISIKAVGTSFNITAYSDEPVIEATVQEGRIQIINAGKTKKNTCQNVYLNANQKFIISTSNTGSTNQSKQSVKNINRSLSLVKYDNNYKIISNINPELSISWKDENWIIEQERLDDFAIKLQRRYNVKIIFADESLKAYTFSGIIKNETLEQVLKAIHLTAPIEYDVSDNIITFSASKRLQNEMMN